MKTDEEWKLSRWPVDRLPPKEEEAQAILRCEGLSPFRMVDPPFTWYHRRARPRALVQWVLRGELLVGLDQHEIVLKSGDRLDLPAGTRHTMRVLSEDGAVYLLASQGH